MKESIYWDLVGIQTKIAVVELCGWRNKHNKATPMGKRIASTSWDDLTLDARNVLISHGIQK